MEDAKGRHGTWVAEHFIVRVYLKMGVGGSSVRKQVDANSSAVDDLQRKHRTVMEEMRLQKLGMPPAKDARVEQNSDRIASNAKALEELKQANVVLSADLESLRSLWSATQDKVSTLSRSSLFKRKGHKSLENPRAVFRRKTQNPPRTKSMAFRSTSAL